jgi:DNA polymerase phi
MIFQKMLEGTAEFPDMVTALFSQNFVGCLMNQAAREDRYLHRAALKALKGIETTVEKHPKLLPTVLKQLLSEYGAYNFDQRTNTKTVDKILQQTTPATVKAVVKLLKLKDPSKSGLDEEKYYQALGFYLSRLASASSEFDAKDSSKSVPGTAIKLLTELAYSNGSVPENTKDALRMKCTAAFSKLARRPEDFGDLCGAILSIDAEKGEEDDENAWAAMLHAYERLKELLDPAGETKGNRAQRQALALLHAVGILQFHNRDPDATELFDELEECYNKLSGEEEGVSEFLVEILLAMVSRPSSLMRQVSQQVFEAFTPLISAEALSLLTDPLETDESEKGQQALFSTEDEDMADADAGSDDGSDEEELDSNVEIVDLEDAGSEAPEESDEDSDDEEKETEEKDKDQDALDALDNALAEVLNSHRLDKDADAESSDDGSDMSDSEMMDVDAKLAEIFKQRAKTTSKKKEKKEAKDTVVNFKHRILDLLAIFVKKEAAVLNPLAFDTLLPLLQLIRTTTAKPLATKACDIIQNFSKSLKKARSSHVENDDIEAEQLTELLKEIHHEAAKGLSHAFAKAVSTSSLAVASVLCANKETRGGVFELYAQTQLKWFEGTVKIQQAFFSEWLQWCQSHASAARTTATTAVAEEEEEDDE